MKKMRLGEIADVIAGQSPPSKTYNSTKDGLPFFQGKVDFQEKHPKVRMWCNSKKRKEAEPGDILISVRAPVGSVNLCDRLSIIGRGLSAIRPRSGIHADYLYYYFKMNEDRVANLGTGSTFKSITQDILKKIIVPIPYKNGSPDLDDQNRIATLLSKVESLIARRKKSIADLDELLKSTFLEMFGDPVRNEMGWEESSLEKCCEKIIDCPHKTPVYSDTQTGFFCIRSSDIVDGYLDLKNTKQVDADIFYDRIKRVKPIENDILYCREGGRLGNAARILTKDEICLGQRIMLFRKHIDCESYFLWALLESSPFKQKVESLVGGGGAPRVNIKDLKKITIIKPARAIQSRFATIAEKVEALKKKFQNSLNDLESLYGALSQKAFKGELDLSRIPITVALKPNDIKMDAPQVRNPDLTVQDESVKTQETREQFLMSGRRTEKSRTIF